MDYSKMSYSEWKRLCKAIGYMDKKLHSIRYALTKSKANHAAKVGDSPFFLRACEELLTMRAWVQEQVGGDSIVEAYKLAQEAIEARRQAGLAKPSRPQVGASKSIQTVSGGLPTLGKGRR